MDWPLAISRNREALLSVIAALFALAGVGQGAAVATLPRHVYRAVLSVLRPAESAVRRLIIIAARGLVLNPGPARAAPLGLFKPAGLVMGKGAARGPAFCLIDPLKHFAPFTEQGDDGGDVERAHDGFVSGSLPRVSVPGFVDLAFVASPAAPAFESPLNAAHLFARLAAIRHALDNLPKQARRLARWQARRNLALKCIAPYRAGRISPLRPGPPPGQRQRSIHAVDNILRECHSLAFYACGQPDPT